MRRAVHLVVAATAFLFGVLGAHRTASALTIDRVSSSTSFVDGGRSAGYAAYRVTNDDAVLRPAVWIQVGDFSLDGNVGLAPHEDGLALVGPLAPGASRTVYFYLAAERASWWTSQHVVTAWDAWPDGQRLARAVFANRVEGLAASAKVIIRGADLAPAEPVLGGALELVVTASIPPLEDTRELVFTPSARLDWPADALQLVGAHLAVADEADVDGPLAWIAPRGRAHPREIVITYRFRAACAAATTAEPEVIVDPGCARLVNDAAAGPAVWVPPVKTTPLVLSRAPTAAEVAGGATLVHTLVVENASDGPATFDELVDELPDGATYVAGSSRLDRQPLGDPRVDGPRLRWTAPFALEGRVRLELAFAVTYPSTAGLYVHRAWGEASRPADGSACGDGTPSRIDTTPAVDDFAPATAEVGVELLRLRDDLVPALEGAPLGISIAALLDNDAGVDPLTFALATATTDGGAPLAWDPGSGLVTMTAIVGLPLDGFAYIACSALDPAVCATARVVLDVNRHPSLATTTRWVATGTARVPLALGGLFTDPDSDGLGAIAVEQTAGGVAFVEGDAVVYAPDDPTRVRRLGLHVTACDDGAPPACASAILGIVYNDPPVVYGGSFVLARGDALAVPMTTYLGSLGAMVGDDPSDGDEDGLASILVGPSGAGPWDVVAHVEHGASCRVEPTGDAVLTAPDALVGFSCWVRVCEERPVDDPGVCASAALHARGVACLTDHDCEDTEVCVESGCVERDAVDARDDRYLVDEGVRLTIASPERGVLGNDVYPAGSAPTATLVEATRPDPAVGAVLLHADGTFVFMPGDGFVGDAGFDYALATAHGGHDRAHVTVFVNGAPRAADDVATTPEDVAVTVRVLDNDVDANGDPLAVVRVTSPPHHGHATIVGGDALRYVPAADWHGHDALIYMACDPYGACDEALVELEVTPVVDPPFAVDDHALTVEDTPVLLDVLANDLAGPDGVAPPLRVTAVFPGKAQSATAGRPELLADQSILFTPGDDRSGPLWFGYQVCDARHACAIATVRVDVLPVNDPPAAAADGLIVRPLSTTALPVLANDHDPEGEALRVTDVIVPARHGTTRVSEGQLWYAPDRGATGDLVRYRVCDSQGACAEADARIVIDPADLGPAARDDAAVSDGASTIAIDVLGNDRVNGRGPLHVAAVSQPSDPHGTVALEDGVVLYTPDRPRAASERFTYTACDPRGVCGTAAVEVALEREGPPPVPLDDVVSTARGEIAFGLLLGNDWSVVREPLAIGAIAPARHGLVRVLDLATGFDRASYDPVPGFLGDEVLRVAVADGAGSAESLFVVHVLPTPNHPPVAVHDVRHARMVPPTEATGGPQGDYATEIGVRLNDSDPDGDLLTVIVVVMPSHGTVRFSAAGDPLYRPVAGYYGPDRFTYVVADQHGARADAVVDLVVGDRDLDALSDFDEETILGTDPDDADTDGDGLDDRTELGSGEIDRYDPGVDTDPLDADSDDDGLGDGTEVRGDGSLASWGATDPLDADTDGDGLGDGLEVGLTVAVLPGHGAGGVPFAGTDLARWRPDADPTTVTDPLDDDSDDDGLVDGAEDLDHDGRWTGAVAGTGEHGSGETDPLAADTDGDGILDGTELGLVVPGGHDTDLAVFTPDADPTTVTDPLDLDTDDGSLADGLEDLDHDGRIDPGETNPNWPVDDRPMVVSGGGATGCESGGATAGLVLAAIVLAFAVSRGKAPRGRGPRARKARGAPGRP